jgi:hypothetical protein
MVTVLLSPIVEEANFKSLTLFHTVAGKQGRCPPQQN